MCASGPGRAVVEDPDHEGRARDLLGHAERAQCAAHEGRLARAEVARDEHDVARPQPGRQRGAGRLGSLGPRSPSVVRRSCTDASCRLTH